MLSGIEIKVSELQKVSASEKLSKKVMPLYDYAVYVGIPAGDKSSEGITNSELAFIHSNGVLRGGYKNSQEYIDSLPASRKAELFEKGSPLYRIPPRPFVQPALNAHKREISNALQDAIKQGLENGKSAMINALNRLGMRAERWVRLWFVDPKNGWAPNAPSTIKQKKSSRPLIRTGELRKSITYVVRKGGKDI